MSKLEKVKERILNCPKDYTYTEIKYLLGKMGLKAIIDFPKGIGEL